MQPKDIVILALTMFFATTIGMLWRTEQVFRLNNEIARLNVVVSQTQQVLQSVTLNKGLADTFTQIGYVGLKVAEQGETE